MASHIERRKFLATLGGAAAVWPFAVRAQQPAVELKFVTEDGCCFSLKDANPGAVETWRRFAADLVAANNGTMFPIDPTGRVIELPTRGAA